MKTTLAVSVLLLAVAGSAAADRAEDDLQAVKKAVASSSGAQAARPVAEAAPRPQEQAREASRKGEPQWFRVRIVEKGGKRARVSVNLPLALVRSLGDDWPIGLDCKRDRDHGHGPTLGQVLRALDAGESLVEIEDEESTVRVWVD
jgi:hypothetical protein